MSIHFGILRNDKFLEETKMSNKGEMVKYIIFVKFNTVM